MSEPPLHNPHDKFFKETLGRTTTAAEFFRAYLPPEVASKLDWDRLERKDGSFVDETLRDRHADLLFTVPWKEKEVFLYCLFEHQSSPDRWMAFRLLRYMVRIWEKELKRGPRRTVLPPILPLVLHQGVKGWRFSRRFRSLMDLPGDAGTDFEEFVPDFAFHLVDLANLPIGKLRGDVLLRAILAAMRVVRERDWVPRLEELAPLLNGALRENDSQFVRTCLEYVMGRSGEVDLKDFRGRLERLKLGEIKEDVMTFAEQLIREGRQEGRQEGRLQTLCENILDILETRFGEVPGEVRKTLKGIGDEVRLKALHRRAVVVGSLEEFLEGL
jgi:predicted transposase/invertase (TIGR01784 family)